MAFINTLYNLWPNGDQKIPGLRDGIARAAPAVFAKYGITSPLLVAHVMAQISHECGAGHDVVENLNYTASRMTQVWPKRFPTIASAQPYANNPRALGNKTYNGRMGNRPGTDDGYNFRGRGGSQCTGRDGYERLAKATGLDVVNNPDLILAPKNFLLCAVADFVACGCLPYAKKDDIDNVTLKLNGGHIGLSERKAWLAAWKKALGDSPVDLSLPGATLPPPDIPKPVVMPPPPPQQGLGAWLKSIFIRS